MKIKHMHLHEAQQVPGLGELKRTVNDTHHKGIDMEMTPEGVMCKYNGAIFLVPYVNCKCLVLEFPPDASKA